MQSSDHNRGNISSLIGGEMLNFGMEAFFILFFLNIRTKLVILHINFCDVITLSAAGTYNYTLAKWLDEKLKPLSSNSHTISDIFSFADELQDLEIHDSDILVSYDVTMFTNIPLNETISILVDKAFESKIVTGSVQHITSTSGSKT